jgi:hypothetical protein
MYLIKHGMNIKQYLLYTYLVFFSNSFIALPLYNVGTFQVAFLISLIISHCQGRFHSVWLLRIHNVCFLTTLLKVTGLSPKPNPEGQFTVFIIPRVGWPCYTPRHRAPILVAIYDLQGLQWDCSVPRSPKGDKSSSMCYNIRVFKNNKNEMGWAGQAASEWRKGNLSLTKT